MSIYDINFIVTLAAVALLLAFIIGASLMGWRKNKHDIVRQVKAQPVLIDEALRGEIGNGHIVLMDDKQRSFLLFGGAYRQKPEALFGVKMAKEIDLPCDISVPTRDFSVPDFDDLLEGLAGGLEALETKGQIYVGCMGGYGRTGLYLLCLYAAWQIKYHPEVKNEIRDHGLHVAVSHMLNEVRERYCQHAVETSQQFEFSVKVIRALLDKNEI